MLKTNLIINNRWRWIIKYILATILGAIICTISIQANAQSPEWTEVAQGVWKTVIGIPDELDLLTVTNVEPKTDAISLIDESSFPFEFEKLGFSVRGGKTKLRFPLARGEQIFGFGLNFQNIHQRGRIMRLHVDHYGGRDNGRTHAPVPFYVSERGYGVFVNSARYIDVYAGTGVRKDSPNAPEPRDRTTDPEWTSRPYSDALEMVVPAEGVEVYVFAGPTALDAVRRYNLFNGGGPIPPRWGLGFWHRTPTHYSDEDVLTEAQEFSERGFPLDVIGLEPGWHSRAYPNSFVWDEGRFPEPIRFIRQMEERGLNVNLWMNPYVSPDSPVYEGLYPLSGSHTVWLGIVPDYTIPEARQMILDLLKKEHIDIGVSGYKIDETDGYDHWLWPDVAEFPSDHDSEQLRQTYGLWTQKTTYKLFRQENNRTYGLTRASNAGANSYPYVLYSDYYNHRDFITALINSSFAGVLWTPEVRSSGSGEDFLRRMQTVTFSSMAQLNAWSSGTKPWTFPEVEEEVKEIALLRMQLLPYFYTAFARYHFKGIPPFRAMNLEEGFTSEVEMELSVDNLDENPYLEAVSREIRDQYMAGEYLLVAPLFEGETSREVVLPQGRWYDFYTGKFVGEGEVISVEPGLDKIPVFVKDGGIISLMPPSLRAPGKNETFDLVIRHYGIKEGNTLLYDDDGSTFNYERGEYSWRELKVEKINSEWQGSISDAEQGKPDNIGNVTWKFMSIDKK